MEYLFGFHAIGAVLNTNPALIKQIYSISGRNDQRIKTILELASKQNIQVVACSRADLEQRVGAQAAHQGLAALIKVGSGFDESLLPGLLQEEPRTLLILDEVQDPHNLGACLRSANAFGVQAVIAPKDHSASLTPVTRKVASGAAELTPFIQVTNLARTMKQLQQQGIWLVGLCGESETRLADIDLTGDIAIVMGNEASGLRKLTRKHCDYMAKIPLTGQVESLNVSAATAIALYEMARQRSLVTLS